MIKISNSKIVDKNESNNFRFGKALKLLVNSIVHHDP